MSEELQLVAVYGSLKKGYSNHRLLETSTLLGSTRTESLYTLYNLGAFPAIGLGGDTAIKIEVYAVDTTVFGTLDMLEGYPSFYNRKVIDTEYGEAWMYYLEGDELGYDKVSSGVW